MPNEKDKSSKNTWEHLIEKREDEPPNGYAAFLAFAALPPSDRDNETALPILAKKIGLSEITIKHYRAQYGWEERVTQIDAQRWLEDEAQRREAIKKDNHKFIAQNRLIKERANDISLKMIAVVDKLLTSAMEADEVIEDGFVETKDGRQVPTTRTIKMKSKISDIPRLAEVPFKLQRYVNDLPTEIIENELPIGQDLSGLTIEQLTALQRENRQKMMAKGALPGNVETISDEIN